MDATYTNPVHTANTPDPFVLRWCGRYWLYATGQAADGRCFPVLTSTDLVDWTPCGGALAPLPGAHPCYWAPEVTEDNGIFYLYYSVGDEAQMAIRVATARHPAGPFVDSGRVLTSEPFAIDPHVFRDDDGTRYLFYATDFLDHPRIGTGTVRARLRDWYTLAEAAQPVTRAIADWQIYDPQRAEKGGVRWHTVEGAFVLKRAGRYYQLFSGGNWQNTSYGVSYAVTDDITRTEEWAQAGDGSGPVVLRTLPGQVIGPGHNSVVTGPDLQQQYCVYHRWSPDYAARQLAIDLLSWDSTELRVHGPSVGPQPQPNPPCFIDLFDAPVADGLGARWAVSGQWESGDGIASQPATTGRAWALPLVEAPPTNWRCEVWLRTEQAQVGAIGLAGGDDWQVTIALDRRVFQISATVDGQQLAVEQALVADYDPAAFHRLQVTCDPGGLTGQIDQRPPLSIAHTATDLPRLMTTDAAAQFAGFSIGCGDAAARANAAVAL